ncbi:MAG: hypothetical protein ABW061_18230 [Polyangiaceae bacterium]
MTPKNQDIKDAVLTQCRQMDAPRDFPNDILAEFEDLKFNAPEINVELPAPEGHRPVIIVTSNSERDLPDAFLRRCVYYDIPFPDEARLRDILAGRLRLPDGSAVGAEFTLHALGIFGELRKLTKLRKKPATAELIAWMAALTRAYPGVANPLIVEGAALSRLGVLIKSREDLELATRTVREYKPKRGA